MRKLNETREHRIARLINRCFEPVKWERQAFYCGGDICKSVSGETVFYEVKQIDNGIRRLNRLIRCLDRMKSNLCPHCGEDCSSAKECRANIA